MQKVLIDIAGQRFGRLVALEVVDTSHGHARWRCRCDCGGKSVAFALNLRKGKTTSCGCYRRERSPLNRPADTHGQTHTAIYRIWGGIKTRCFNEHDHAYPRYGGRGVTMCVRWSESFENFRDDLGPRPSARHSVERVDNGRGYEPGNCVWATRREQARNMRTNVRIEFRGDSRLLCEWAEMLGISGQALRMRLRRWSLERAMTEVRRAP